MGEAKPYAASQTAGGYCRIILGAKTKRRIKKTDDYYRQRALQPWVLATSLESEPAEEVERLYSTRMQIEESFRDTKNNRFGWALDFSRTTSCGRINALLLIASLAHFVVVFAGLGAERAGVQRYYQANTVKKRRVLSLFTLGNLVPSNPPRGFTPSSLTAFRKQLIVLTRQWTRYHKMYGGDPPHDLYCPDCGEHFKKYGWPVPW